MEPHFQLSDKQFEQQFENATLEPSVFRHEAHLRLAWIHLRKYGPEQTIINLCHQIRHFASVVGESDKYNKTLTIAAIKVVHHFMQKAHYDSFEEFILAFPRLKYHFRDLINAHYQTDIFKSELAKHEYLEPDLLPFD